MRPCFGLTTSWASTACTTSLTGFQWIRAHTSNIPAEELYAVLSLESHRHKTMLIGEDLGTVPTHIPKAMKEHGVGGMFVSEFELRNTEKRLPIPVKGSLASIGTHDTAAIRTVVAGNGYR